MRDRLTEDFVTNAITAYLAASSWELRSVAAPGMGSGTILRPNPDATGRRPKIAGGVVIDVIARKDEMWLFLENKDRFSASDLLKLAEVRDSGRYSEDLARLTGSRSAELRFGLGMPDTEAAREHVKARVAQLDCFVLVSPDRSCACLGSWSPASGPVG